MAGFSTEGVMPMMPYGGMGGNDGFGGGNCWWIFIFFILFAGGGFGGFGNRNGMDQFSLLDIKNNQRNIETAVNGVSRGICDSTYALNDSIKDLGFQSSKCCCETNRNIDSVKYDMSKGLCDIITNNNMNTRDLLLGQERQTQRILDELRDDKMQNLRDKNQELTMTALLQKQTANILGVTNPRVVPAYNVCDGQYPYPYVG